MIDLELVELWDEHFSVTQEGDKPLPLELTTHIATGMVIAQCIKELTKELRNVGLKAEEK